MTGLTVGKVYRLRFPGIAVASARKRYRILEFSLPAVVSHSLPASIAVFCSAGALTVFAISRSAIANANASIE